MGEIERRLRRSGIRRVVRVEVTGGRVVLRYELREPRTVSLLHSVSRELRGLRHAQGAPPHVRRAVEDLLEQIDSLLREAERRCGVLELSIPSDGVGFSRLLSEFEEAVSSGEEWRRRFSTLSRLLAAYARELLRNSRLNT
ncbi:MAG: hypothetical protein DRO06_00960 [Thermoproteota archaeon]|nr:MAG: hypothetical protein DRO06_00960 [Candidatus Korarchaeota archaeon]